MSGERRDRVSASELGALGDPPSVPGGGTGQRPDTAELERLGLLARDAGLTYLDDYDEVWISLRYDLARRGEDGWHVYRKGNWVTNVHTPALALALIADGLGMPPASPVPPTPTLQPEWDELRAKLARGIEYLNGLALDTSDPNEAQRLDHKRSGLELVADWLRAWPASPSTPAEQPQPDGQID